MFYIDNGSGQFSRYCDSLRAGRSNPGGGRDFPDPSIEALGPIQPPIHWVSRLSPAKRGWGVALSSHSHLSAEVKEIVEL